MMWDSVGASTAVVVWGEKRLCIVVTFKEYAFPILFLIVEYRFFSLFAARSPLFTTL
jgi:hypothetical protein